MVNQETIKGNNGHRVEILECHDAVTVFQTRKTHGITELTVLTVCKLGMIK